MADAVGLAVIVELLIALRESLPSAMGIPVLAEWSPQLWRAAPVDGKRVAAVSEVDAVQLDTNAVLPTVLR